MEWTEKHAEAWRFRRLELVAEMEKTHLQRMAGDLAYRERTERFFADYNKAFKPLSVHPDERNGR